MNYEEAKAIKCDLELKCDGFSKQLQQYPRGPMGLTPDSIKSTDEWKAAKAGFDMTMAKLRKFNSLFMKAFKKEIQLERRIRRSPKVA